MLEQVLEQMVSKCLSKHQANRKQSTEFREKSCGWLTNPIVTYVTRESRDVLELRANHAN